MKAVIYYFSGTGNSLKVAKDIAAGLGDTEIISIGEAIKKDGEPAPIRLVLCSRFTCAVCLCLSSSL